MSFTLLTDDSISDSWLFCIGIDRFGNVILSVMVCLNSFPLSYVCMCVSLCVRLSARFLKNDWTNLHEIVIQNAYDATDVSFGAFDPLAIISF